MNERIRAKEVRVINELGEQIGVMTTEEALGLARDTGLDLVEVAPTEKPPVCKIMDFGKFKYQQGKHQKQPKHHTSEIKAIRVRPRIDEHDLGFKMNSARRFLEKGYKVQVNVFFKGREGVHPEMGTQILQKVVEDLQDIAVVERAPTREGNVMSVLLSRNTTTKRVPPKAQTHKSEQVEQENAKAKDP